MPLSYRGYGAYISCDGQELEAHQLYKENDNVISCYVASEAGKEFKVHWVDSKPPSHLSVEIRMDGSRMGVLSHTKQSTKTSIAGFRIAIDAQRLYQFTSLNNNTDDDILPFACNDEVGTIEVKLRRVLDFVPVTFTPKTPPDNGRVHERSRKAHGPSHRVSLGNRQEVKAKPTIMRPLLIDHKPYVIFRFFYRPKEYLESHGIIRRRSGPAMSPSSSSSRIRKKRAVGVTPPSTRDSSLAVSKRQRTTFEEDISMPITDDASMSLADDLPMPVKTVDTDDSEENIVEIHLSSKNNFAFPRSSQSSRIPVKREVKSEPSADSAVKRQAAMKREPSPIENRVQVKREPSLVEIERQTCIKRELSPAWVPPAELDDVKLELENDEEEETIIEFHLSSKDFHAVRTEKSIVKAEAGAQTIDWHRKRKSTD